MNVSQNKLKNKTYILHTPQRYVYICDLFGEMLSFYIDARGKSICYSGWSFSNRFQKQVVQKSYILHAGLLPIIFSLATLPANSQLHFFGKNWFCNKFQKEFQFHYIFSHFVTYYTNRMCEFSQSFRTVLFWVSPCTIFALAPVCSVRYYKFELHFWFGFCLRKVRCF